jgi:hypothetical protein
MRANQDIRTYAEKNRVYLWEIADVLSMHDSSFSRLLRHEFSDENKTEVFSIIDRLAAEREVEDVKIYRN